MKHTPNKHLGQNFLINQSVLKRIVTHCQFNENDVIVEIGPGKGALTKYLLEKIPHLTAIEKDAKLVTHLQNSFEKETLTIINQDILEFDFSSLNKKVKVIGNIPYNISSVLVEKLIHNRHHIESAFLTTQLEFGKRLASQPNCKDYGALSCFAQFYADINIHFKINPGSFSPVPKVVSCFLSMDFSKKEPTDVDEYLLFKIIRNAFGQRRKTIQNSLTVLKNKECITKILSNCDLNPQKRAEQLALQDYINIAKSWEITQ